MKKILDKEKQFNTNFKNIDLIEEDCLKIREIINRILNKDDVKADDIVKAMEHTRTCNDCGKYLIEMKKS